MITGSVTDEIIDLSTDSVLAVVVGQHRIIVLVYSEVNYIPSR